LIIACGGQSLDVGSDPARGGAGPSKGGGAGYAAVGGSGARGGVATSGKGGGAGTDIGAAGVDLSEGSGGRMGSTGGGTSTSGGTTALGGTAGVGGTRSPSIDEQNWPTLPTSDTDESLKGLVGTWEGDVEDFYLQPVEHLRVEITGATDHSLSGTVTWGTDAPPPPPTDPDAPYPSAETSPLQLGRGGSPGAGQEPVEGFPYTIRQGAARSGTVRFSTWKNEPWRGWCALQPVFMPDAGQYSCSPSNGFSWSSDAPDVCMVSAADGTTQSYPYPRCLCFQLCLCDAEGCTSQPQEPRDFDLTLNAMGDVLSGPFTGSYQDHPDWAYRLTRAK
jgi:hypothetical protein